MSKNSTSKNVLHPMQPPVGRAMVFICQECGQRVGKSTRNASYELAENLKHAAKREFGKREVRVVLTSCMDCCPEGGISVLLQPVEPGRKSSLVWADVYEPEASSEALLRRLRDAGRE
jgi:predicted metal-binding protein